MHFYLRFKHLLWKVKSLQDLGRFCGGLVCKFTFQHGQMKKKIRCWYLSLWDLNKRKDVV